MEARRNKSKKREAVMAAVRNTDCHPTAEMLYESLKSEIPGLSLATVYRNLNVLEEEGRIVSVSSEGGRKHYDARTEAHAHFACRLCHEVWDVELPELGMKLCPEVEKKLGCSVETHSLCFSGICRACKMSFSAKSGENID